MASLIELAAPKRWGRDFRHLLSAAWTTNLADGILRTAMPLLAAQLTTDPVLIALTFSLSDLAALVFGLFMGVLADRYDRRRLLILGNLTRVVLLAGLTAAIATQRVTISLVLAAVFLLAIAETLEDSVAQTLTPMIVPTAELGAAATRLQFGFVTMNSFAGPSVGALLFAVAWVAPYELSLLLLTIGAALVYRMRLDARPRVATAGSDPLAPPSDGGGANDTGSARPRRRLRRGLRTVGSEIVDGLRWTWQHDAVRTLVVVIFAFNLTFGAGWSMLVLYSKDQLHLPPQGYGMLLSAAAVGGIIGTLVFTRLERRFALATLLRFGLIIETFTYLALVLTTNAVVAAVILFFFGVHASVWGSLSTAVRQRATPRQLQGRVASVYQIAVFGGLFIGGLIGGALTRLGGVATPYWFGFFGSALILMATWRAIGHIAHTDGVDHSDDQEPSKETSQ